LSSTREVLAFDRTELEKYSCQYFVARKSRNYWHCQ
jgi:hypothetical protein